MLEAGCAEGAVVAASAEPPPSPMPTSMPTALKSLGFPCTAEGFPPTAKELLLLLGASPSASAMSPELLSSDTSPAEAASVRRGALVVELNLKAGLRSLDCNNKKELAAETTL